MQDSNTSRRTLPGRLLREGSCLAGKLRSRPAGRGLLPRFTFSIATRRTSLHALELQLGKYCRLRIAGPGQEGTDALEVISSRMRSGNL